MNTEITLHFRLAQRKSGIYLHFHTVNVHRLDASVNVGYILFCNQAQTQKAVHGMKAAAAQTILGSRTTSRRMILVDIENFNGLPIQSAAQAKWCKKMLTLWLNIQEGEIVIIAADRSGIFHVNEGWNGPRLLVGLGHNGADLRLIEEIDRMNIGQFDEIALVSGGVIFADVVAKAADQGVPTTVYGHEGQISEHLQFTAAEVRYSQNGYTPAATVSTVIHANTNNVIQLTPQTKEVA